MNLERCAAPLLAVAPGDRFGYRQAGLAKHQNSSPWQFGTSSSPLGGGRLFGSSLARATPPGVWWVCAGLAGQHRVWRRTTEEESPTPCPRPGTVLLEPDTGPVPAAHPSPFSHSYLVPVTSAIPAYLLRTRLLPSCAYPRAVLPPARRTCACTSCLHGTYRPRSRCRAYAVLRTTSGGYLTPVPAAIRRTVMLITYIFILDWFHDPSRLDLPPRYCRDRFAPTLLPDYNALFRHTLTAAVCSTCLPDSYRLPPQYTTFLPVLSRTVLLVLYPFYSLNSLPSNTLAGPFRGHLRRTPRPLSYLYHCRGPPVLTSFPLPSPDMG